MSSRAASTIRSASARSSYSPALRLALAASASSAEILPLATSLSLEALILLIPFSAHSFLRQLQLRRCQQKQRHWQYPVPWFRRRLHQFFHCYNSPQLLSFSCFFQPFYQERQNLVNVTDKSKVGNCENFSFRITVDCNDKV